MKNVGIITMHKIINYGSALQAYALQTYIERLGYKCTLIDYAYPNEFHLNGNNRKLSCKKIFMGLRYRLLMSLFYHKREQVKKFEKFWKDNFHLTKPFLCRRDLFGAPPSFDLYVTGSDQVWNPRHMKGDSSFFCDFIKNGANRIAYAASISSKQLHGQYLDLYESFFNKYSAIGVREKSAVGLVSSLSGQKTVWVCDPTMLLRVEDYSLMASSSVIREQEPYLLIYILGYNFNPHPMVDIVVEKIANRFGLKKIYLQCNNVEGLGKKSCKMISAAGPNEFLYLFKNASFVITSSFHGTVYSLLFEKQFISLSSMDDDRIPSLLEFMRLEDRLVVNKSDIVDFEKIDFTKVRPLVEAFRNSSEKFLKESITKYIL